MARIASTSELKSCDECDAVCLERTMSEVSHFFPKGKGNHTNDYCRDHRQPYDMHTTTSGYDRHYRGGKEVDEEGHPIIRLKGARKSARPAPPPTR